MLQHCCNAESILLLADGDVLTLPLEEYLRSVVPAEMPASWPMEALKAQAVAARTYALHCQAQPRHRGAHLCATQHCQVWRPQSQHPRADEAIAATAGEVLLWRGEPICAMYSANCGGHTDDGNKPYLRGVPCPAGGGRRGHGLGLCQHGARLLAERGKSYRQILAHYYTVAVNAEQCDVDEAVRAAAWACLSLPYNRTAALARYAHQHDLGAPQGPESDISLGDVTYRLQPFSRGIVYAPAGAWQAVQHIRW